MKKLIALLTLTALAVMTLGPVISVAEDDLLTTGLSRGTGGGSAPIVKAKWEMNAPYASLFGTDDSTAAGAQFNAPGVWDAKMNYSVCAVVTDPNGADDIAGVYADIYYPLDKRADKPGDDPDVPTGGCGAFIEQNTLVKLSKTNGYNLFCDTIRNTNNNLPVFNGSFNYDEICAADGELMKETAFVYCDDKTLIWEDPAGNYKVVVTAQDQAGNNSESGSLTNYFAYLPLTKFAVDFTNVNYGEVMLNIHKKVSGDKVFSTGDPTVRNLGNTRLDMKVAQDDMGLGQSSGVWNVKFDARVGNNEADWKNYNPFGLEGTTPGAYTTLKETLDLSETEEMDFSILVTKWPDSNTSYGGNMWLSAALTTGVPCTP